MWARIPTRSRSALIRTLPSGLRANGICPGSWSGQRFAARRGHLFPKSADEPGHPIQTISTARSGSGPCAHRLAGRVPTNQIDWADPSSLSALSNCQSVLKRMRELSGPVAFVRRSPALDSWSTRWLTGFMPDRSDMVFERQHPSCYASEQFADMADTTDGDYVLAGLFSESACLATAIDAFHRGHRPTFLADASTSRAAGDLTPSEVHHAVTAILGFYVDVVLTQHWIELVLAQ